MGEYNVTVWRVDAATEEVISVQVAELVGGNTIVRANGMIGTSVDGTPEYHARFVALYSTFAGKPCLLFVSNGTKGFKAALKGSLRNAFINQFQRPLTASGVAS